MTPAQEHEEHVARVLGIPCATIACRTGTTDSNVGRQHHDEDADALVVEALRMALATLEMHFADCPITEGCTVCASHGAAIGKANVALEAMGK